MVSAPMDQDHQMQADIDRQAAEGQAAAAGMAAANIPVPPGMERWQFPQDANGMMQYMMRMMEAMRSSLLQAQGIAGPGGATPRRSVRPGAVAGDKIRTRRTCGWANELFAA